jgi:uncharacterized membrane protein YhaH (DUF805 family)
MGFKRFFFSFDGRINRTKFWLGAFAILGTMLLALALLATISTIFEIGNGRFSINLIAISASVHMKYAEAPVDLWWFPQIVTVPMQMLFGWAYAAIAIKRLHDRDNSAWWIIPYVGLAGLNNQFGKLLGDTTGLVAAAVAIPFIWGFIELGFLKGTAGTNRFGANPLPKQQTRPRSTPPTASATPLGWDQHSELELIPQRAGSRIPG